MVDAEDVSLDNHALPSAPIATSVDAKTTLAEYAVPSLPAKEHHPDTQSITLKKKAQKKTPIAMISLFTVLRKITQKKMMSGEQL